MTSLPTGASSRDVDPHVAAAGETPSPLDKAELRDAIIQAPALICVTRGPGHIIEAVSALFLRSIGGRNVVGQTMQESFPDLPRERIDEMTAAYATGQPYEGKEVAEAVATESGVTERFLNLVIQPLRDPAGSVYGLMTHAVDVTDAVRTRQELAELALALERSNRELDSFAYAASHDLRAPLRGIANLAQWIEEDLESSGELKARRARCSS